MKNRNTLGRAEYVWNNVYWAFLLFLWYRNSLFCPVFGFDYKNSVFILAGLVILGIITGILLTHKRRRNHVSILCNQILSYGSYFVLSLWGIDETMFVNTLIVLNIRRSSQITLTAPRTTWRMLISGVSRTVRTMQSMRFLITTAEYPNIM